MLGFSILVIIAYSLLVSGLCIAIASKSKTFKEAQSALTPLTFISFFPGMIAFMMGITTTPILSIVPFLNFTLIFTDINNVTAKVQHTTSDSNERVALKGSILVVEDNPVNQKLLVIFLEKAGFNVTVASNGQEAVDIIKNNREFNVIFMDIHMPVMDGVSATKLIREMGVELPIIALTANVIKEDVDKFLANGMNDYIAKPINFDKLQEILLEYSTKA